MKETFGLLAVVTMLLSNVPYFWGMFKGRTKPHVFSWAIWGIASGITFAVQWKSHAGAGAWAIGVTSLSCFLIAFYGLFNGTKYITRSDCLFFGVALAAIPLWYFSHNPFWALCLAVGIDFVSYYPTVRKAYILPYDENATCFALCVLRDLFSLVAIQTYSVLTMLYLVVFALTNSMVVMEILWRRRIIERAE